MRTIRLLLALLATGCAANETPPPPGSGTSPGQVADVREADLRATLGVLAADSLRGRMTGSPGADAAARYIAGQLAAFGVAPAYSTTGGRDSAYFQRVPIASAATGDRFALLPSWEALDTVPLARRVGAANVVGVIAGSDPTLAGQAVVVAAHYDHVGVGRPVGGDSIYNGADDDATGVATVLEIARALAAGPAPRRTVVFLLTTGEEIGLLGTRWYIDNPRVPLERTVAEFEIEMVGRPDPLMGGPGRTWLTGFERSSMGEGLAAAGIAIVADPRPDQQFFQRSDNIAFACRGIPAHTLSSFGLHEEYHTPDDEIERIDFAHMRRAVAAAVGAARLLVDGPAPAWHPGLSPLGDPRVCGGF